MLLEYVDGTPLSRILKPDDAQGARQPLSPERAVRIAKQVASGLVVAHANKVLHRDLKPENILIVKAGANDEQGKLVDFGIAKMLGDQPSFTSKPLGTPHYMAPEQLKPDAELDRRVDLWQLGATLHTMLTGQVPYPIKGGALVVLAERHNAHVEAGPFPSEIRPTLSSHPTLDRLVSRLLTTNPEKRPRSALLVVKSLRESNMP